METFRVTDLEQAQAEATAVQGLVEVSCLALVVLKSKAEARLTAVAEGVGRISVSSGFVTVAKAWIARVA